MTNPSSTVDHQAVATKHRAMWATGDYPRLAAELVSPLGPVLVDATGIAKGDHVLDVAAGTGNAAIPAAETGASVVASDLCPDLLEAGARSARRARCRSSIGARPTPMSCPSGTTNSMW